METGSQNTVCLVCGGPKKYKKYCSRSCYEIGRLGEKRSQRTRDRIAAGNTGKIFSPERRRAISESRFFKPSVELLSELQRLWKLRCLNPKQIRGKLDLSQTVYNRLKKEYCIIEQAKFLPANMTEEELALIDKLGGQKVYVRSIAAAVSRGHKNVHSILKHLGHTPNTRNPERRLNFSRGEERFAAFLDIHGIAYDRQFPLGPFFFDFRIRGTNCLIEINGDYWHCNPLVYLDGPINEVQRSAIRRDFCKRARARDAGYKRLVIWEQDVRIRGEEAYASPLEKIRRALDENQQAV